ncbi:MAG TPA: hypothetical protein VF170_10145, partial [Planctomycetaceae bacterium]
MPSEDVLIRTFFTDMRATLDLGTSVLFFAALAAVWYGGLCLFLPRDDKDATAGRPAGVGGSDEPPPSSAAALAGWTLLAGWTVLLLGLTYTFRKPLFGLF